MPRNYLCRPRPRAFTPRAGSHKSHAIGAFAVRRYPPEAEYNTGGLARCSALEHTHLLPLALTTSRREDNFSARPTKSLKLLSPLLTLLSHSLALETHLLHPTRSPDLQSDSGELAPVQRASPGHTDSHPSTHPFTLYPAPAKQKQRHAGLSFETATTAAVLAAGTHTHAHARTHDAGTAGRRTRSLAQVDFDPQLLSSVRHPGIVGPLEVYSGVQFLRLSLPPRPPPLQSPRFRTRITLPSLTARQPAFAHSTSCSRTC